MIDISDRKLLVFELAYGGHYASYIRHLAEYWCKQDLPGHLDIVVSPQFVQQHPDVVGIAAKHDLKNLNFVTITPEEAASLIPRKTSIHRAFRSFQEWRLLRKYTTALGTTQCLLLYFDSFQAAVASGATLPCPFSGIYFRPTFHYSTFADYTPSWKNHLQHWRERFIILPRVLHHPKLRNLFCLDSFVVKPMEQFHSKTRILHLPDPVQTYDVPDPNQLEEFKQRLKIAPGRTVFLLFGALYDRRKGIHQVLEAISTLSPTLCNQICLLLVGQLFAKPESPIQQQITDLSQSLPVQIIVQDQFIPEQEVQWYFHSADIILAPYQGHVGMSGTLVQAAAVQKPLLASNYGLMGAITRLWRLGITIDATKPSEIAQGLTQCLQESPDKLCDRSKMKAFAVQNSAERFASILLQDI
ncbi:MAG: glycosyltransferase [Moorea sp. SIO3G5]|nr:glycosyltransferase [Moorena sp. SIO3G5]